MARYSSNVPSKRITRLRSLAAAALAAIAALLVAASGGCDHRDRSPTASPRPSGSPSPSPSVNGSERDAVAAYRGMWNAFVEAGKTADPDAPAIRTYASDDALKLIVGALATDRHQGKIIKGDLRIDPHVTELRPPDTPTEATVLDCVDSTNWLEYKTSGELWDNEPGGKHRTTATVSNTGGTWKVSRFTLEVRGTC